MQCWNSFYSRCPRINSVYKTAEHEQRFARNLTSFPIKSENLKNLEKSQNIAKKLD